MSLDNVLAISGAAHGDMTLVIFGVGLSIPIVIWGSGLLARLMARLWWIVDVGAAILGWVAGEMILGDRVVQGWLGGHPSAVVTRAVQGALAILVMLVGRAWARAAGAAPWRSAPDPATDRRGEGRDTPPLRCRVAEPRAGSQHADLRGDRPADPDA